MSVQRRGIKVIRVAVRHHNEVGAQKSGVNHARRMHPKDAVIKRDRNKQRVVQNPRFSYL
jgi:hypothetical protein